MEKMFNVRQKGVGQNDEHPFDIWVIKGPFDCNFGVFYTKSEAESRSYMLNMVYNFGVDSGREEKPKKPESPYTVVHSLDTDEWILRDPDKVALYRDKFRSVCVAWADTLNKTFRLGSEEKS